MDLSPFSEFMANNNDAINQFSNHLSDELACADRVLADEFARANSTIEMILKVTEESADEAKEDNTIKATAQVEATLPCSLQQRCRALENNQWGESRPQPQHCHTFCPWHWMMGSSEEDKDAA
jgi:hypothetical protein